MQTCQKHISYDRWDKDYIPFLLSFQKQIDHFSTTEFTLRLRTARRLMLNQKKKVLIEIYSKIIYEQIRIG